MPQYLLLTVHRSLVSRLLSPVFFKRPALPSSAASECANSTTAMTNAMQARTTKKVDCSQMSQNTPICVSLLPIAVATNQPPISRPRLLIGATFETSDKSHRRQHKLTERHDHVGEDQPERRNPEEMCGLQDLVPVSVARTRLDLIDRSDQAVAPGRFDRRRFVTSRPRT